MKIVVDAMGTDDAPHSEVAGCVRAFKQQSDLEIVLVGPPSILEAELKKYHYPAGCISIEPAADVIGMDEKPAEALRKKPGSSIAVGARLLADGKGDAFVSAGNTGAVAAASLLYIGRAPGVKRPGIASLFPSRSGFSIVIDVGANVSCKGVNLYQFAVMGEVYYRAIFGKEKPSVGLLSLGEEEEKGYEAIFEAHKLLEASSLNYAGHVEGSDILRGTVDVVTVDGFTGNALLKFAEAVPSMVFSGLRNEAKRDFIVRIGAWMSRAALRRLRKRWDYAEYGGAPLLGVKSGVIICHGKSSPKAIKNAVLVADKFGRAGGARQIAEMVGSGNDER